MSGVALARGASAADILQAAGAAVVNLPDFFGPGVSVSTLQQARATRN